MDEGAVKEYLIQHDASFRKIFDEHQAFERKLTELTEKPFLTTEEQMEETTIKKKKLALKDLMQARIQQHQSQAI